MYLFMLLRIFVFSGKEGFCFKTNTVTIYYYCGNLHFCVLSAALFQGHPVPLGGYKQGKDLNPIFFVKDLARTHIVGS